MSRMKRPLLLAAVLGLLALSAWGFASYPRIGGVLMHGATRVETAIYGLHASTVTVADSRMMSWQGGPSDARETVVMIHGYSADKTVWMRFARYFTPRYRVLILDLPGHGETAFDPALHYDTLSQARRVVQAMDALGIARAHLVGNSMGGFIAAQIALHQPERVQTATLIDAAGVISPQPSDMDRMLAAGGRNPFEMENREQFRDFYAMTMAQPPWLPQATLDYMAQDYIARRTALARIFRDFHHVDLLDARLADIRVPVLVMWGDQDRLVHRSAAEVWSRGIPGAELRTYPDLGHMPMVEAPARSAQDVLDFLSRHAAPPPS